MEVSRQRYRVLASWALDFWGLFPSMFVPNYHDCWSKLLLWAVSSLLQVGLVKEHEKAEL